MERFVTVPRESCTSASTLGAESIPRGVQLNPQIQLYYGEASGEVQSVAHKEEQATKERRKTRQKKNA